MVSTCDLMDAHPEAQVCEVQFRCFGARPAFFGRIRTVQCYEDNALMRSILEQPGNGNVLIVDGGGSLRTALIGDVIATLAMNNGWAGVVVYGCVRDADTLDTLAFGIKALGTNPRKSGKTGAGQQNAPVSFGSTSFIPGHYVYSDRDGIVVSAEPIHE